MIGWLAASCSSSLLPGWGELTFLAASPIHTCLPQSVLDDEALLGLDCFK